MTIILDRILQLIMIYLFRTITINVIMFKNKWFIRSESYKW